jgi:hypothetical protein
VSIFPRGGCIEEGGSPGDENESDSTEVGVDGHVHMPLVPILVFWLEELAGLTTVHELVVEAKELEEDELPIDAADVDDLIDDKLASEVADAKELEEDDVPLDVADKGVSHVIGEQGTEEGSGGGLTKHAVEVRQLSLEACLVASWMDVACTWSM